MMITRYRHVCYLSYYKYHAAFVTFLDTTSLALPFSKKKQHQRTVITVITAESALSSSSFACKHFETGCYCQTLATELYLFRKTKGSGSFKCQSPQKFSNRSPNTELCDIRSTTTLHTPWQTSAEFVQSQDLFLKKIIRFRHICHSLSRQSE